MEFKRGRDRLVLVFPKRGVVIKIAVVRLLETMGVVIRRIWRLDFRGIYKDATRQMDIGIEGYKDMLLGGILANWREFLFFLKTRNSFLQPTYFSLFGLINVQKMGDPCTMKWRDLWYQFCELTDDAVNDAHHHFAAPGNFCFDVGKLKIVDYGNKKTQKIIIEYGSKIVKSFDQKYDWEKARAAKKA